MVQQSVSSVRTKRVFSEEFKVDAVRIVTGEGYSIAAAAKSVNRVCGSGMLDWLPSRCRAATALRSRSCGPRTIDCGAHCDGPSWSVTS